MEGFRPKSPESEHTSNGGTEKEKNPCELLFSSSRFFYTTLPRREDLDQGPSVVKDQGTSLVQDFFLTLSKYIIDFSNDIDTSSFIQT